MISTLHVCVISVIFCSWSLSPSAQAMPSPPLSSALLRCPVPQSLEATASAPDPPDHCHLGPRAERQHPLPPEMAESQHNTSVLCGHRAPHRTSYTSDFELCNPTTPPAFAHSSSCHRERTVWGQRLWCLAQLSPSRVPLPSKACNEPQEWL